MRGPDEELIGDVQFLPHNQTQRVAQDRAATNSELCLGCAPASVGDFCSGTRVEYFDQVTPSNNQIARLAAKQETDEGSALDRSAQLPLGVSGWLKRQP
jgi:hypothetical protein